MTQLRLPWPPTTNQLHTVSRGRKILSSKGREYRANATAAVHEQGSPRLGSARLSVTLTLHPPTLAKRDIANFEKAVVDALVFARVLDDDEQIDELRLVRGDVDRPDGQVVVTLEALPEAPGGPATTRARVDTTPANAGRPSKTVRRQTPTKERA